MGVMGVDGVRMEDGGERDWVWSVVGGWKMEGSETGCGRVWTGQDGRWRERDGVWTGVDGGEDGRWRGARRGVDGGEDGRWRGARRGVDGGVDGVWMEEGERDWVGRWMEGGGERDRVWSGVEDGVEDGVEGGVVNGRQRGARLGVERCGWGCKWKTEGSEIGRGAVWMGV